MQVNAKLSNDSTITTDNCKYSTVTIVPHKSDDSQNVLLKQLLQNSGSTASPMPTIVSRSVTSLRAPSLGVVSTLEAQLARPVILPVPATPNAIQSKPNVLAAPKVVPTAKTFTVQSTGTIQKANSASTNVAVTLADTSKNSMRTHQILSRETSFISKPVAGEGEKDIKSAFAAATTATMQSMTSTTTATSTALAVVTAKPEIIIAKTEKPITTLITVTSAIATTLNASKTTASATVSNIATPVPKGRQTFQTISETKVIDSISHHEFADVVKIEPMSSQPLPAGSPIVIAKSTNLNDISSIIQTIKKEEPFPQASPSPTILSRPPSTIHMNADVKRELLDDSSQMSIASDHSSVKQESLKEEPLNDSVNDADIVARPPVETALEAKRRKRREYQKQRRQMQIRDKELAAAASGAAAQASAKKKPKKATPTAKIDEDFDTYIDNLVGQLKSMPPMQILEPSLNRHYTICTAYGAGDMSKFGTSRESRLTGRLIAEYGRAELAGTADYYNTKPFGAKSPITEQHSSSTHYGFYDQEFSPIKFSNDDDYQAKLEFLKERDIDTPDTIISSSSPECVLNDSPPNFPGLRLITEDDDDINSEELAIKRMSPPIPIIAPVPIRLKKGISLTTDANSITVDEKSSVGELFGSKSGFGPPVPIKDDKHLKDGKIDDKSAAAVTITLTLSSSAADDILSVLQDLANILHIPAPKAYKIVERTTTPPSQKLGLYRTRDKDGKEGAPIDIQTILNGKAKFCRHCDVVILNTVIRAKVYEFPLLTQSTNSEVMGECDDLYFCSKSCYRQFRCVPTNLLEDKIAEIPSNEQSTYDDTVKYSKQSTVLVTTVTPIIEPPTKDNSPGTSTDSNAPRTDESMADGDTNKNEAKPMDAIAADSEHSNDADKQSRKSNEESEEIPPAKKQRGMQYLRFAPGCFKATNKYKKMTDKETTDMLFRMNITVTPTPKQPGDTRKCILCHHVGDGVEDGPSRLLNFDVDKWVHLNCALWSDEVYETVNGALMNLETALQTSFVQHCTLCAQLGATVKCYKPRCTNIYHLNCAIKDNCVFYKNKLTFCSTHASKTDKDNELTTLSVQRRVYVDRDEGRQVASVMHHSELSNLLRVGNLIFLNVGQLLPHQLQNFHTANFIYPIGYKIMRFYWSMRRPNKRCRYICSIVDAQGRPEFRVLIQEPFEDDIQLHDSTPKGIWNQILDRICQLRKENNMVQIFPKYIIGEDLFGLTEPAVVRILESLPGIETLTDYRFKYGRNPLLELPLAINPSGAARTEPKAQQNLSWKKPHTQRSGSASQRPTFVASTSVAGEVACPYSKQFVHSKSSQYKKMKQEWRNNVFLAR